MTASPASPRTVRVAHLAHLIDCTPRNVQRMIREGIITAAGRGFVFFPLAVHEYLRYLQQPAREKLPPATADDDRARVTKARLRIQVARELLRLQDLEERFIDRADVVRAIEAIREAMETALLEFPSARLSASADRELRERLMAAALEAVVELQKVADAEVAVIRAAHRRRSPLALVK